MASNESHSLSHSRNVPNVKEYLEAIPHGDKYNYLDSVIEKTIVQFKYNKDYNELEYQAPTKRIRRTTASEATPSSHLTFENVFNEENVNKLISKCNDPGVTTLLEAMSKMEIQESVELLYLMGVHLTAVKDLYSILEMERVITDDLIPTRKENFNSVFTWLNSQETKLKRSFDFLHGFCGRNVFVSMCNTLNIIKNQHTEQILQRYKHKLPSKVPQCLVAIDKMKCAVTTWNDLKKYPSCAVFVNVLEAEAKLCERREIFKDSVSQFHEKHHQNSFMLLLSSSFVTRFADTLHIPFNLHSSSQQEVEPDLVSLSPGYCLDAVIKLPALKEKVSCLSWGRVHNTEDGNIDSLDDIHLFCPEDCAKQRLEYAEEFNVPGFLIWQLFEQLLGRILEKNRRNYFENEENKKLFQSSILLANDVVHVFTMSMELQTYQKFKKCFNLKDTLRVILSLAKAGKRFCNFYICSHKYHICDTFALSRGCSQYFDQLHKVSPEEKA